MLLVFYGKSKGLKVNRQCVKLTLVPAAQERRSPLRVDAILEGFAAARANRLTHTNALILS